MDTPATAEALQEKVLTAIATSAEQAFETMVFCPLQHNGYVTLDEGQPCGAISGSIGLTGTVQDSGKPISGSVSLMFEKDTAEAMFRSMMMMGEDDPVVEAELKDAIGELANMVAGGAKSSLQGQGINFAIGLPTTVIGAQHNLSGPSDAARFCLKAASDKGPFVVSVILSQR
jgi:chemotaxis protein CheX